MSSLQFNLLRAIFSCFCLSNHDFGVIQLPFGARGFVVQTAVCITKTHLANVLFFMLAQPSDTNPWELDQFLTRFSPTLEEGTKRHTSGNYRKYVC